MIPKNLKKKRNLKRTKRIKNLLLKIPIEKQKNDGQNLQKSNLDLPKSPLKMLIPLLKILHLKDVVKFLKM